MSEMIERVARALAQGDASEPDPDTSIPMWRKGWQYESPQAWVDAHWRDRKYDAIDAIRAMREPTLAMDVAADEAYLAMSPTGAPAATVSTAEWRARIDAALNEGADPTP